MKITAQEIGPQHLPKMQNISPRELPFIPNQQHPEEEEKVGRIRALEMQVKLRVHELHEMIEREKLFSHPALVPQEVPLHALHEMLEAPEGDGVVLHHGVDGGKEVGHALDVAEVAVVFVVG